MLIVAYALSPIDLIPDFIPVIGYLDELILLPVGIWLVIEAGARGKYCWMPAHRRRPGSKRTARSRATGSPPRVIVLLWIAGTVGAVVLCWFMIVTP